MYDELTEVDIRKMQEEMDYRIRELRPQLIEEVQKKEMTARIVTTLRQDALKGLISKESPVGQALMGHRVGDRVQVAVSPELKYTVEIRSIEKGTDDESLDISSY